MSLLRFLDVLTEQLQRSYFYLAVELQEGVFSFVMCNGDVEKGKKGKANTKMMLCSQCVH